MCVTRILSQVGCGGDQAEHQRRSVHLDTGQGGDIWLLMVTSLHKLFVQPNFRMIKHCNISRCHNALSLFFLLEI